jgi:hypothetical protein
MTQFPPKEEDEPGDKRSAVVNVVAINEVVRAAISEAVTSPEGAN